MELVLLAAMKAERGVAALGNSVLAQVLDEHRGLPVGDGEAAGLSR